MKSVANRTYNHLLAMQAFIFYRHIHKQRQMLVEDETSIVSQKVWHNIDSSLFKMKNVVVLINILKSIFLKYHSEIGPKSPGFNVLSKRRSLNKWGSG